MKKNIESSNKSEVEWEFPCYGRNQNGVVVHFVSRSKGTIIKHPNFENIGAFVGGVCMDTYTPCILEVKDAK